MYISWLRHKQPFMWYTLFTMNPNDPSPEKTQNLPVNIFAPPPVTSVWDNPNHALLLSSCQTCAWLPRSPSPPPSYWTFQPLNSAPVLQERQGPETIDLCVFVWARWPQGGKKHGITSTLARPSDLRLWSIGIHTWRRVVWQVTEISKFTSAIWLDDISL